MNTFPNIKLYADTANLDEIRAMAKNPRIAGFTTNPSLMRKAGVLAYDAFAKAALEAAGGRPVSFEVLADEEAEMERQARLLASWGENVYVKIPVVRTDGSSNTGLVLRLCHSGVKVNVTALLTQEHITEAVKATSIPTPSILSVFAGRIADTGRNPETFCALASYLNVRQPVSYPQEILWASTREAYNIAQAARSGCHIITVSKDILEKAERMWGRELDGLAVDTVRQFVHDARWAGYRL